MRLTVRTLVFTIVLLITAAVGCAGFSATSWAPLPGLSRSIIYSTVLPFNGSLVVVGGCLDNQCTQLGAFAQLWNVRTSLVGERMLGFPIAGRHSSAMIDSRLYTIRYCGFGGMSTPPEDTHKVFWTNINNVTDSGVFSISGTVARVNSSCVAFNGAIYIIGGVLLEGGGKGSLTDEILVLNPPSTNTVVWGHHSTPNMNSILGHDSAGFYVVGGLTPPTSVSQSVNGYFPSTSSEPCSTVFPSGVPLEFGMDFSLLKFSNHFVVLSEDATLVGAIAADVSGVATWSQVAISQTPMRGWSLFAAATPNSQTSNLTFFRFGGIAQNNAVVGLVASSVTTLWIPQLSAPAVWPVLQATSIGLQSTSECAAGAQCKFALRLTPACEGAAGETGSETWSATGISFTPHSVVPMGYVCFSSSAPTFLCGLSQDQKPVPRSYVAMNVLSPIQVGYVTTASPASGPGGPLTFETELLIGLGAAAAVAIVAAALTIRCLRKRKADGVTSTEEIHSFSHQEERYKTIAKVGEGAFSSVYLVLRRKDGKKFAMKHMDCQTEAERQDAIKECEIMRSLQGHPNVITLVDMFMNFEFEPVAERVGSTLSDPATGRAKTPSLKSHDSMAVTPLLSSNRHSSSAKRSRHLCLVMEFHQGGDLKKWVTQYVGYPNEAVLCSIAFQIVSVLVHIHGQNPPVIHRDLKPENLLISNAGTRSTTYLPIIVTDFGLARLMENGQIKHGAGTLPYVAPECFRSSYTTQCDMWSLGCVLYALATKRISHENVRLMFEDCRNPNFGSTIRNDLCQLGYQPEFAEFILHLLRVDPKDRLTAKESFKLFRHKGDVIYVTSKLAHSTPKAINRSDSTGYFQQGSPDSPCSYPKPEISAEPIPRLPDMISRDSTLKSGSSVSMSTVGGERFEM
jgi:serine/threonine protein kinase